MSEENNSGNSERFDDLFRGSLGSFKVEPSPRVWSRLNRKLLWNELIRFNFTNVRWYTWLAVGTTAVILGTGIFLLTDRTELPAPAPTPALQTHTDIPVSHPVSTATNPSPAQHTGEPGVHPTTPPTVKGTVHPVTTLASASKVHSKSVIPHPSSVITPATTPDQAGQLTAGGEQPSPEPNALSESSASPPPAGSQSPAARPAGEPILLLNSYSAPAFSVIGSPGYVKLLHIDNPKPSADERPTVNAWKHKPESSLGVGLDIAPQIVFYKVPDNYFKYNYTFDLGVQYNLNRFYIQAAAGFTWSSDIGNFAVYYTRNDSIGYIYSVDSFTPDPLNPGKIIYHTKMETVFDSNNYVYDYNTQNTYYYLQFPLIVGYKVFSKPLWSLSVEAGGLYMLMVKKDEPAPVFYIPDTRVDEIQRQDPVKNTNSFGLTAGIRLEYSFTKDFFLVIEPTFNYYLDQVQESGSVHATQPYAIGLRAGLWYRIGINSKK